MFGSFLPPVVCRRNHVLLAFACACVPRVVASTCCVVFYFVFLRFVYPMLPVSLDCSFLIAPSVFLWTHIYTALLTYKDNYHQFHVVSLISQYRVVLLYFILTICPFLISYIENNLIYNYYWCFQAWEFSYISHLSCFHITISKPF